MKNQQSVKENKSLKNQEQSLNNENKIVITTKFTNDEVKVKKQPQSQKKSKSVNKGKNSDKKPMKKVVKSDKKKVENTENKTENK